MKKMVTGKLRVASINKTLDKLLQTNTEFLISATLKRAEASAKESRSIPASSMIRRLRWKNRGAGETIYSFTAARVREE